MTCGRAKRARGLTVIRDVLRVDDVETFDGVLSAIEVVVAVGLGVHRRAEDECTRAN